MAIAFRSRSAGVNGSGTNPTIAEGAGWTTGDLLLSVAIVDSLSAAHGIPASWISLYSGVSPTGGGSGFRYNVAYIVRGASAPSLTWTHTGTAWRVIECLAYSGVNGTTPIDAQSSSGASVTGSGDPQVNPGSVTAVSSAAMAVAVGVDWAGPTTVWTPPSGYTLRSANNVSCMMADKLLSASGAEDPGAYAGGMASADDLWHGATITLNPDGSTRDQEGFRWRNDDGSEATATWQAAQDAQITLATEVPVRVRFVINATNDPPSAGYELEYRKTGESVWFPLRPA